MERSEDDCADETVHIRRGDLRIHHKMLMDAIEVNPDARPVITSMLEALMDNHVPQESWGTIFFRLWQQLNEESS